MLNQLDELHLALTMPLVPGTAGIAWRCENCHIWWGSQNGRKPTTRFLLCLPAKVSQALPWDEYRGWKLLADRADICPECGQPTGRIVHASA